MPSSVLAPSARLVGSAVLRREDPRLLTGHGRYVDDVTVPGMAHAHFVRSNVARGNITRIDTSAAREVPGVIAVLTAHEINPHQQGRMWATPLLAMGSGAPEHPLADGDVRFVGDPIALIVATSRAVAEDAAELIEIEIEAREPVIDFCTAAESAVPGRHIPGLDECLAHALTSSTASLLPRYASRTTLLVRISSGVPVAMT